MNELRGLHPSSRQGRGATTNPAPRYLPVVREVFDDGWGQTDESPPPLRTSITPEKSRTIISHNSSPDVSFDASINPYKGCEHGCVYCFARPTHAYLDLSPGLDFESKLTSKPDAAATLKAEFSKKGYRPQVISLGANTDPYQPIERDLKISRQLLDVFVEFKHPVSIVTKSNLVLRDLDLLQALSRQGLAAVILSITTLDRGLARHMEPRAPTPERRLEAVRTLADAGVPVGVLTAPMIPGINDHELERLMQAARDAGANNSDYVLLRLPLEIKELFEGWLQEHFPDRKNRVLNLVRTTRGGKLYDSTFGTRMVGSGPYAELLQRRYEVAHARIGFPGRAPLRTDLFRVPARAGDQLRLFGGVG